jgi:hypothetical protein
MIQEKEEAFSFWLGKTFDQNWTWIRVLIYVEFNNFVIGKANWLCEILSENREEIFSFSAQEKLVL